MSETEASNARARVASESTMAGVVVPVARLAPALEFLESLGLRVETIFPADDPVRCTLVGFGCRVHLEPGLPRPMLIRLAVDDRVLLAERIWQGPDGLQVEFVPTSTPLSLPALVSSFSLTHENDSWHLGRAGMHYRDLVPDRQGGAVIASHIRVPGAGPVADYVHFHEIAFQLIYCRSGTVTVVYEDQGEPFVLGAGDCVTQPPRIRHRVLSSSDDLEVIEIGYPAEHVTRADPATHLPTSDLDRERVWDGQTFVHHRHGATAPKTVAPGVRSVDTGVAAGTRNLADVSRIDIDEASIWSCPPSLDGEFVLLFVLDGEGSARLVGPRENGDHVLASGTAVVVPVLHQTTITAQDSMSMLQVRVRTR